MNKYFYIIVGILLAIAWGTVQAISASPTSFGGTGTTTPSGILYGDNGATNHLNTVKIGSGLTFSGGTLSSSGSGSGNVSTSSSETATYIPFWTSTNGTPALLSGGTSNLTWDGSKLFANYASSTSLSVGSEFNVTSAGTTTVLQLRNKANGSNNDAFISYRGASADTNSRFIYAATDSAIPIEINDTAGNHLMYIDSFGVLRVQGLGLLGAASVINTYGVDLQYLQDQGEAKGYFSTSRQTDVNFDFINRVSTNIPITIVAHSAQAVDLTQWRGSDDASNILAGVNKSGGIYSTNLSGFGTTTPRWTLQVASSTGPQLALTDNTGIDHWTFRNANGSLYFATSSNTTFATSSIPALTLASSSRVAFFTDIPTTKFHVKLGLNEIAQFGDANNQSGLWVLNVGLISQSSQNQIVGAVTNPIVFYTGGTRNTMAVGTERMRLTVGNFLGIATSTPQWALNIATTTRPQIALTGGVTDNQWTMRSIGGALYFATSSPTTYATSTNTSLAIDTNGQVYLGNYADCSGTNALQISSFKIVCGSTVSDIRLKKDISPVTNGLDIVSKLKPITFYWKDLTNFNTTDPREQYGFSAQDVMDVVPSAVSVNPQGYYSLDKSALIAPIVDAIHELNSKVDNLSIGRIKRSSEENWQWIVMAIMFLWIIKLEVKKNK